MRQTQILPIKQRCECLLLWKILVWWCWFRIL